MVLIPSHEDAVDAMAEASVVPREVDIAAEEAAGRDMAAAALEDHPKFPEAIAAARKSLASKNRDAVISDDARRQIGKAFRPGAIYS